MFEEVLNKKLIICTKVYLQEKMPVQIKCISNATKILLSHILTQHLWKKSKKIK